VCGRQGYYHPCVNQLSMPILSGCRPLTEPRDTAATAAKPCGRRMSSTSAGGPGADDLIGIYAALSALQLRLDRYRLPGA